jgi:hypothetical protein
MKWLQEYQKTSAAACKIADSYEVRALWLIVAHAWDAAFLESEAEYEAACTKIRAMPHFVGRLRGLLYLQRKRHAILGRLRNIAAPLVANVK